MSTLEARVLSDVDAEFFASAAEDDPDRPSPGFDSIHEAVQTLRKGGVSYYMRFTGNTRRGSPYGCITRTEGTMFAATEMPGRPG